MSKLRSKAERLEKAIARAPRVGPCGVEIPPASSLDQFIYGPEYLNLEGVIFPELYKLLKLVNMDAPQEFYLEMGRGSGKSFLVSCIMAMCLHHLLSLESPQGAYGLAEDSLMAVVNVSVSERQARDVCFHELKSRVKHSPWFQSQLLEPPGVSMIKFKKNIIAVSGSSSEVALRGYNVFCGAADEASFMLDSGGRSLAEELSQMLKGSMLSRFPKAYKSILVSSPRSIDDYLNVQVDSVKKEGQQFDLTTMQPLIQAQIQDLPSETVGDERVKIIDAADLSPMPEIKPQPRENPYLEAAKRAGVALEDYRDAGGRLRSDRSTVRQLRFGW